MSLPEYVTPIFKLTERCNYQCCFCRYAYLVSHDNEMNVERAKQYIEKVIEYNMERGHLVTKIIFHGGEPLLWGIENFEKIMKYEKLCEQKYGMRFINAVQTNGYLINSKWIHIFKNNRFQIGISLDGPVQLNSHFGKNGSAESIRIVLDNIGMLRKENLSFGILSVISSKHLGKEKEFYDFWIQNKIENIGLCYCYDKEENKRVNADQLGDFLIKLFDLYFWGNSKLKIREFDNAMARILHRETNCCTNLCRKRCGYYLTVKGDGSVNFCDEYELGNDDIVIGNLNENSIKQIVEGKKYQELQKASKRIIIEKCNLCEVYNICASGCHRNDIFNGEGNYFCEAYEKIYMHMRRILNNVLSKNIER